MRAERSGRRAARLQHFTASLSRALTAEAVYDVALDEGRELRRRERRAGRAPVEDSSAVEMVATFGFSDEETRRLAPLPALAAHSDR